MRSSILILVLAFGWSGCAHYQLTNRQVAVGVVGAAAVTLIVFMLVTQCDDSDPNDCNFQ